MASWGVAKVLLAGTGKGQEDSSFQFLADKASDFVLAQIFSYVYPNSAWFDLIAAARACAVTDRERQDALAAKRNARIEEILRRRKRSQAQKEAARLARQKKHQERMNREYQKYWKKPGEMYIPESKKKTRKPRAETVIAASSPSIDDHYAGTSETARLSDASTLNFALRRDEKDPRWIHCKERMQERNVTMDELEEALESGLIFPDYSHTETDSSLHRWKFYHEESGLTAITNHWVDRPVTSWIADSPPKRQNNDCHETKCCRFPNNGRCLLCEEHCHPT